MVPFQRIVCPVDFSEPSYAALDTADELAVRCGAELCVVHVVPPVRMIYPLGPYPGFMNFEEPEYERVVCETAGKALSDLIKRHPLRAAKVRPLVRCDNVADGIVGIAEKEGADLIVSATHGLSGWRHLVFGSVAEKVLRLAHCPVLIIHRTSNGSEEDDKVAFTRGSMHVRKILCPTDYSKPSYAALEQAGELAIFFGAQLYVVHVVPQLAHEIGNEAYMSDRGYERERLAVTPQKLNEVIVEHTPSSVESQPLARLGHAAEEIARAAESEKADLIVMSTHGLSGWRHLMFGSVAEKVLRLARCPVLVIHTDDERTGA